MRQQQLEAAFKAIVKRTSRFPKQPRMDMFPLSAEIRIYPALGENCIYNPEYFFKVADVFNLSSFIMVMDSLPYIIIF